jgi:hypothetical protein
LSEAGAELAAAGSRIADALGAEPGGFSLRGGAVDLQALGRARTAVEQAIGPSKRARRAIERSPHKLLIGSLRKQRAIGLRTAVQAERALSKAAVALRGAPDLLGTSGPRRYFVAMANLSELRGTGGYIGYYALLEADHGRIALRDRGRPWDQLTPPKTGSISFPDWFTASYSRFLRENIWPTVNLTTDFPTVGRTIVQAAQGSFGQIDGVIQIDPEGVRPLLDLTGPVTVAAWPNPIDSANIARVTQFDAYLTFADNRDLRVSFLGRVVAAIFDKLLSGTTPLRPGSLGQFGALAAGGHVQMYSTHPAEQDVLTELGVARGVDRAARSGDVLGVVGQSAGSNKTSWFLRRTIGYTARLEPSTGSVESALRVELKNNSPASGLPAYVLGGVDVPDLAPGYNRQLLMVLRPPDDQLAGLALDGRQVAASRDHESSLRLYTTSSDIAPGATLTLEGRFRVPGAFKQAGDRRTFELLILKQPTATDDRYAVSIQAPPGWRVKGRTIFQGELKEDLRVRVQLVRDFWSKFADSLPLGPLRRFV